MNEFVSALILAIVQGFTEWLPVSSSGHLVLFHKLLGYEQNLAFDVTVHFGTLMAVFVYFGKDIVDIVEDFLKLKTKSVNFKLGLLIIAATIPAALIGYVFESYFVSAFSSIGIVAIGFLITSVLLTISSLDYFRIKNKGLKKEELSWLGALFVGCAQALAIFPGISRSGSTISAGLVSGLKEKDAVKFSFLMSAPVIFGASILEIGNNKLPSEFIWATLVSFIIGLISIHFMLKIVISSRKNLRWFALYCLLLALGIFGYLML